jgi:hypothetical protein
VQAAINAAGPALPTTLPQPPLYFKANANGFPIAALALTSDVYDIPDLYDFANTVIAPKLSQIDGVARVFISGAGTPAVRIQVNPRARRYEPVDRIGAPVAKPRQQTFRKASFRTAPFDTYPIQRSAL